MPTFEIFFPDPELKPSVTLKIALEADAWKLSDHTVSSDSDNERLADIPEDCLTNSKATSADPVLGKSKFISVKGIAAPLERSNVDTDAIIPKQFLKSINRTGFSEALFYPLRYNDDGTEVPEFVLNQQPYRNAKILVVNGSNFGCGSSREHAPWALLDFGIRVIVARSYADIFFNNMFKNGMLPVIIKQDIDLKRIVDEAKAEHEVEVDLVHQVVKDKYGNILAAFEVEEYRRHCLLEGLDEIDITIQREEKIAKYERRRTLKTPWLDGSEYMRKGRPAMLEVGAKSGPKLEELVKTGQNLLQW